MHRQPVIQRIVTIIAPVSSGSERQYYLARAAIRLVLVLVLLMASSQALRWWLLYNDHDIPFRIERHRHNPSAVAP